MRFWRTIEKWNLSRTISSSGGQPQFKNIGNNFNSGAKRINFVQMISTPIENNLAGIHFQMNWREAEMCFWWQATQFVLNNLMGLIKQFSKTTMNQWVFGWHFYAKPTNNDTIPFLYPAYVITKHVHYKYIKKNQAKFFQFSLQFCQFTTTQWTTYEMHPFYVIFTHNFESFTVYIKCKAYVWRFATVQSP